MTNEKLARFLMILAATQLLGLLAFGQMKRPPTASLRFLLVDTFGNHVEHFEVNLENTVGSELMLGNPLGRYTQKYDGDTDVPLVVPFGAYKLTVMAPGLESTSIRLLVDQPQVWIPVALSLGSITPNRPEASLTVTVSTPIRAHPSAWIKASELYSNGSKNAQCDQQGHCRITNLRPGRYAIFAFDGGKLLSIRTIGLHVGENALAIASSIDAK